MNLRCSKCKQEKPTTEFYRERSLKRGFAYQCKVCKTEYNKKYFEKNRVRRLAQDKKYYRDNKEKKKKVHKAYREANRIKRSAHKKVEGALRSGVLKKPKVCSTAKCRNKKVEAHHNDYNKPLDVIWLCRGCHGQHHAKHGPGKV